MSKERKMDYKVGDIIDIDGVNEIKNELYRNECPPYGIEDFSKKWERIKRNIKRRVKFQIIEL